MTALVGIDDIQDAARLLSDRVRETPLLASHALSVRHGRDVFLKAENLQRTGSFKIRGAYTMLARLPEDARAHGVVAASAGNHAQGVALAADLLDTAAVVFMPESTPIPKVAATRGYGAEVRLVPGDLGDAIATARRYAAHAGATLVPPFDHPHVIAGHGPLGLDLAPPQPEDTTVLVPGGRGGLAAGVAAALTALRPDVRIVGVQAGGADAARRSLEVGAPVAVSGCRTIADGIAVNGPSELTFAHLRDLVGRVLAVDEEAISGALLFVLERAKLLVEPAAAVAVAALAQIPGDGPVTVVLSGGNVDANLLTRLIRHGLTLAGRYLLIETAVPDQPGELARCLGIIADRRGNVLSVDHQRFGVLVPLGMVDLRLTIETRDPEHGEEIVAELREAGYAVTVTSAGALA